MKKRYKKNLKAADFNEIRRLMNGKGYSDAIQRHQIAPYAMLEQTTQNK